MGKSRCVFPIIVYGALFIHLSDVAALQIVCCHFKFMYCCFHVTFLYCCCRDTPPSTLSAVKCLVFFLLPDPTCNLVRGVEFITEYKFNCENLKNTFFRSVSVSVAEHNYLHIVEVCRDGMWSQLPLHSRSLQGRYVIMVLILVLLNPKTLVPRKKRGNRNVFFKIKNTNRALKIQAFKRVSKVHVFKHTKNTCASD